MSNAPESRPAACVLGIEVGGTKLQLVAGDSLGAITLRERFHIAPDEGGDGIRNQVKAALPNLLNRAHPTAIGVGFGGPVDFETGAICCSHQIEGWSDFPLGDWLRDLTGLPVAVENDANTAALAEATVGAGKDANPMCWVNMGSGVGGGLVANGSIYHGARPGEAEIGHLRLDKSGATVESRCSGWAVDARIRALKETDPDSALCRLIGDATGGEARHLPAALEENDATAIRILNETADDLAFGLSHAVQLFHPEAIVMGGGLSLIGEPLRAAVAKALPKYTMAAFAPGPDVRLAALGEDAVTVGALLLAARAAKSP